MKPGVTLMGGMLCEGCLSFALSLIILWSMGAACDGVFIKAYVVKWRSFMNHLVQAQNGSGWAGTPVI